MDGIQASVGDTFYYTCLSVEDLCEENCCWRKQEGDDSLSENKWNMNKDFVDHLKGKRGKRGM